ATTLAEEFGSMDELLAASVDDLSDVEDVGPVIAESVHSFLHSKQGERAVSKLREAGVNMTAPKKSAVTVATGPLSGKTFVVTGTLQKYKRDEIESLIVQHGGHAASTV